MHEIEKKTYNDLIWFFSKFVKSLSADLCVCSRQHPLTTKHSRRLRAMSFLIETLTGDFKASKESCERLWHLAETLLCNCPNNEASTALQRAKARLEFMLEHPEKLVGSTECVACGEVFFGNDHACTNKSAKSKDVTMSRDDTLL